jgi:GTP-binding protein
MSEAAPAALDAAALESGRLLFAAECRFTAGAATLDALPPVYLPEIAFIGRSNVGKSSLVNALTGRKTLARVSVTPGRTQQINFFELGSRLVLVDLPGYGFARASKQKSRDWTKLTRLYLKGRANLRRALVLIDARHGLKTIDRDTLRFLDEAAVSYQVVLTKADKVPPPDLAVQIAATGTELAKHVAAYPEVLATSAVSGTAIPELRARLASVAAD